MPVQCYQAPTGTIIVDVEGTAVDDSPPRAPAARVGPRSTHVCRATIRKPSPKVFPDIRFACGASGRKLVVVSDGEMNADLVEDMIGVMTSFCARLYGRRSAGRPALAGISAIESHDR